jgi:hypothetical protein
VVVFATETFAPTNVDEVKAADMFVIIKLFLYGVFMEVSSSKEGWLGSTELSLQQKRDFLLKRRSIDRKNCKKKQVKKTRFSFAETDAL